MAKITKLEYKELKKKLLMAQEELNDVMADKTKMKGRATEIVDKMKKEWRALYRWMDVTVQHAKDHLYVQAPHGRRRNLAGMLVPRNDIQAALSRRSVNSPVQGFGTDVGHTAARLIDLHLHKFLRKFKLMDSGCTTVPGSVECAVHDALMMTPEYHLILPTLQIKHFMMTVGVANWFDDYYEHQWLSCPEIETEIGFNEAQMNTWDYTQEGLRKCVRAGLQDQFDTGLFPPGRTVDMEMSVVFDIPQAWKTYLDKEYPWFSTPQYQT